MKGENFRKSIKEPRQQWVSYGTVDKGSDAAPSVVLDGEGENLPYGPMVSVTLQPSGIAVHCRIASQVAGDGEAEYYPFVEGDEVVVLIPEGHERAGALVIGRMNQSLDGWPATVAGQDATKNKFGFRRMRTPFIVETAAAYLIRSALTGSQIGIDALGQVIVNDGEKGSMVIGPEAIGFSSGDGSTFVTLFPATKEVFIGGDTASLLIAAKESKFISQGKISFSTAGGLPNGSAVTAEQVVALLINVFAYLGKLGSFASGPLSPASFVTPPQAVAAMIAMFQPILAAMATPAPFVDGTAPAGNFLQFFGTIFGPAGGVALASANPIAAVDITGTTPGYGRSGFKL